MIFRVSKTVSVVTPESALDGDTDHDLSGFEYEGVEFSFSELVRELKREGMTEASFGGDLAHYQREAARGCAPWVSAYPEETYRNGHSSTYSLHLDNDHDPRARRYWIKALLIADVIKGPARCSVCKRTHAPLYANGRAHVHAECSNK